MNINVGDVFIRVENDSRFPAGTECTVTGITERGDATLSFIRNGKEAKWGTDVHYLGSTDWYVPKQQVSEDEKFLNSLY